MPIRRSLLDIKINAIQSRHPQTLTEDNERKETHDENLSFGKKEIGERPKVVTSGIEKKKPGFGGVDDDYVVVSASDRCEN